MANIRFKAGILARNGEYFGQKTKLPSKSFDLGRCTTLEMGWITRPSDSGVGTPSNVVGFQQEGGVPVDTCAYILYDEKFNQRDRYLITCKSDDLANMQGSSKTEDNTAYYTELAVALGSGYTVSP